MDFRCAIVQKRNLISLSLDCLEIALLTQEAQTLKVRFKGPTLFRTIIHHTKKARKKEDSSTFEIESAVKMLSMSTSSEGGFAVLDCLGGTKLRYFFRKTSFIWSGLGTQIVKGTMRHLNEPWKGGGFSETGSLLRTFERGKKGGRKLRRP